MKIILLDRSYKSSNMTLFDLISVDLGQSLIKLQNYTLKRPRSVAVPTKGKDLLNFKNCSKKLRYHLELKILKKLKSTSDLAEAYSGTLNSSSLMIKKFDSNAVGS